MKKNPFFSLKLKTIFNDAHFLTDINSWHEHVPFAFALIETAQPRIFVELGTHKGDSYFAFCQAIDFLGLESQCYAIDTWQGDQHAGLYGDEILKNLRLHHDKHYGRFSSLVQSTFDRARDNFEDGTIDLLHIDGLHTYRAVKHDFESWLPKLSERGVVIFHDTRVRNDGFGVWKLWAELDTRFPSFEFHHGYGLGVLVVGEKIPKAFGDLFGNCQENPVEARRFFSALGERVGAKAAVARGRATLADMEVKQAHLTDSLTEIEAENKALTDSLTKSTAEQERLSKSMGTVQAEVASLKSRLSDAGSEKTHLTERMEVAEEEQIRLTKSLAEVQNVVTSLTSSLTEANAHSLRQEENILAEKADNSRLTDRLAEEATLKNQLQSEITSLVQEKAALQSHCTNLEQHCSGLEAEGGAVQKSYQVLHEEYLKRSEWALELEQQLAGIHRSISWRASSPIRMFGRAIRGIRRAGQNTMRETLLIVYNALPIPVHLKQRMKVRLFRTFPAFASRIRGPFAEVKARPIPIVDSQNNEETGRPFGLVLSGIPVASVIIPVYGKSDFTYRCLKSMHLNPSNTPYEVIVVDDCSPDNTTEMLGKVQGVKVVRNEKNLGFLQSANQGAAVATGQYLLFLNNDTIVTPGWLDELTKTLEDDASIGVVGSKLLYPDGSLQEAGGIIWNDGSAWNYGRHGDPNRPEYCYARDVDYCSGASLMVRRALFEAAGGFDERFVPAYGEDSDLCMHVRNEGWRVVMQPMSKVMHHEGVSMGTELTAGLKAYQVVNAEKFYEKWKQSLRTHGQPGVNPHLVKDRGVEHRILFIDHCTPQPDHDAGSITILNIMRVFQSLGYKVTFIPEDNMLYMGHYTEDLQRIGIECIYGPFVSSVKEHLEAHGADYDAVIIFRVWAVDRNLGLVRRFCSGAKVLFHVSDLHFLREERQAQLEQSGKLRRQAMKTRDHELALIRAVDHTIVHSTVEKEMLCKEVDEKYVTVFPWVLEARGTDVDFKDRQHLAFVGGYQHLPNVDAVKYFVSNVFPKVCEAIPGIQFYIIGTNPPEEVKALASYNVIVTGFVKELEPLLDTIRLAVVPLRYGAGIKGKIGTTLSLGLPSVATPLAAEGMELVDGENIILAEGDERFSQAVIEMYHDRERWNTISANGIQYVKNNFSFRRGQTIVQNILSSLNLKFKASKDSTIRVGQSLHATEFGSRKISRQDLAQVKMKVFSLASKEEFDSLVGSHEYRGWAKQEMELAQKNQESPQFFLSGFCRVCSQKVKFLVDRQSGAQLIDGIWMPNWRERVVCPKCGLNNRQRAVAGAIDDAVRKFGARSQPSIYLMEQVTPIYDWVKARYPHLRIMGSEFRGPNEIPGTCKNGVRHEDIENLSFPDGEFDIVVSNDVLEHVGQPSLAIREVNRVLNSKGIFILTIPFDAGAVRNIRRAEQNNGQVTHLLSPVYHGDPFTGDGSLVFTDFGWEILGQIREAGFEQPVLNAVWSMEYGHLGGAQGYFSAVKGELKAGEKDYLPAIAGLQRSQRGTRSVYEGYQRGWGLQFGDLRQQVLKDPLYVAAMNLAEGRTILAEPNRMNLFLLLKFFLPKVEPGHIIEFGSYQGGNAIFMAYIAGQMNPDIKVFALDTFAGMPETDKAIDAHNAGDFCEVDFEELETYTKEVGLTNLCFRKGLFEATAESCMREAGKFALAHIDCDVYSAVKFSYEIVKPHMVEGGYIVFDDATVSSCIGATEVVEDLVIRSDRMNSEQIYPHFVFRA